MLLLLIGLWKFRRSTTTVGVGFYIRPAAAAAPTAADDDDDDDYVDEYDLAPAASFFVEFQNQYLPYQLVPWMYLILRS